jgi:pSer/pThr/pTyr-binding forkhead associated (FHA) protein
VNKEKAVIDRKIAAVLNGSTSEDGLAEFVVVVTLPGTPERFTRTCSGTIVIGRGDNVDLQLSHPLVSRRHAELTLLDDGRFEVRDLGSRNGTFVNDERLGGATATTEGEARVQVGPYLLVASPPATTISETLAFDAPRASRTRTSLDKGSHALSVDGNVAIEKLTGLEFALVDALAGSAPRLVPNAAIGDRLWGKGQWDAYMLHNLVRRVRKKLEDAGLNSEELIVTVPGVGYRLT